MMMTGFPISLNSPIAHATPLPKSADIVIIGGGVIGVMSAFYLAQSGARVVLCEKGRIAGEQSSRNWGWIRQQGRDPAELPIMVESNRLWQGLGQQAGEDLGFTQTGVLYLAKTEKEMADFEAWTEHARAHQIDTRLLTAAEVRQKIPSNAAQWLGGLWTASDGRAEPAKAVPALARMAERAGAQIAEGCAVRLLDIQGGRVAGVVTEQGRIACDQVILAGGAWSALFARNHGVNLPQLSVRATVFATEPLPEIFAGNAADDDFAFRRRQDGGYTLAPGGWHEFMVGPDAFRHILKYRAQLQKAPFAARFLPKAPASYPDAWGTPRHWGGDRPSPFEKIRILNPDPSPIAIARIQKFFARAFPEIGTPKVRKAWAGMIDTMPDVVPVIDHAAQLPGLIIATGMSGHGFGIGPGFGRVIADLALGRSTGHDLGRFRLSRFSDGSPITLGPTL